MTLTDQSKPGYYYEHVDGSVHFKPFVVVETGFDGPEDYFDSPFVKRWWRVREKEDA